LEYFVGAAITMIAYMITNKIVKKDFQKNENVLKITYSQSHIYELMAPLLDYAPKLEEATKRQSSNFLKNAYMKVMVVKNKAYWIKDNTFYVADVLDGEVVKENAKEVDTMSMDKVELNEMMFIVEKLREDNNDTWSSGE
jgi:ribosomal 30S subunit maturation factor RimM